MSPDDEGAHLVEDAHRFMRGMEQSPTVTIAAVNSIAFGGGCELAMACDFRIAAESATFGQPEINLGIIPGFGGTQRLPRLVGESKALEMNLTGDPIDAYEAHRVGLANQVVPDHELFDTALSWAQKLSEQAPIAIEEIKKRSAQPDLDEGLRSRGRGLRARLRVRGREGGHLRLPRRSGGRSSRGSEGGRTASTAEAAARGGAAARLRARRRAHRRGHLRAIRASRTSARPGTGLWENVDPMEVAHIDAWRRDPDRFWSFYGAALRLTGGQAAERGPPRDRRAERRGLVRAVITQNIDRLHRLAGTERLIEVHGSIDQSVCLAVRREGLDRPGGELLGESDGAPLCEACVAAAEAGRRAVRRAAARAGAVRGAGARDRRGPDAVRGLVARGLPGGRAAGDDARRRRPAGPHHPGPDPVRRRRRGEAGRRRGRPS